CIDLFQCGDGVAVALIETKIERDAGLDQNRELIVPGHEIVEGRGFHAWCFGWVISARMCVRSNRAIQAVVDQRGDARRSRICLACRRMKAVRGEATALAAGANR